MKGWNLPIRVQACDSSTKTSCGKGYAMTTHTKFFEMHETHNNLSSTQIRRKVSLNPNWQQASYGLFLCLQKMTDTILYNKTLIESHSCRPYGAKLLREIEGQTEAHTYTNLLTYIRPQTAFSPILPTSFYSLAVVWIYANDINWNISVFRPTNSQNRERYQFWT